MTNQDREILTLYGKIAGAMMIILQQSRSYSDLREKTLLFLAYSAASVKTKYDFAAFFMDALCYRILETGLDWRTLEDSASLDVICYKLTEGIRFDKGRSEAFAFVGKGKAECRDGRLRVCSADVGETGNRAFSVFDDRIEVLTRNIRDERLNAVLLLKQEQEDIVDISYAYKTAGAEIPLIHMIMNVGVTIIRIPNN